jgi:hypothetical protein
MKTIELIGQVDAQHRLSADVPADVPPGLVKLSIVVDGDDNPASATSDPDNLWETAVTSNWADELSDTRQDIYSISDGEPLDGAR